MKTVFIILGILAIIIILLALSIAIGSMTFKQKVKGEVKELFEKSEEIEKEIVKEEDLENLPEPVQRYLRYAQVIGEEKIKTVRLKYKGYFRQEPEQKWLPLQAEQYYTTDPPAFIWRGTIQFVPFLSIKARDMYREGKGNMLIKLLSLFTIVDVKGKEMDQGTLLRYLNEMMWFPTAYLNDNIQWEAVDSNSAKGTISDHGNTVSAVLHFNEKGEMTNFVAERYREVKGKFFMDTWSTPIHEYKEINGIRIPTKGEGVWNLESGDFSYIRLEIIDIEYNTPL